MFGLNYPINKGLSGRIMVEAKFSFWEGIKHE